MENSVEKVKNTPPIFTVYVHIGIFLTVFIVQVALKIDCIFHLTSPKPHYTVRWKTPTSSKNYNL